MTRKNLLMLHILATIIGLFTIVSFFTSTLLAEASGNTQLIVTIKTYILYALPLLILAMPTLGITGNKLAGKKPSPKAQLKLKRMKFIAINGIALITLAVLLYFKAVKEAFDTTFWTLQILELLLGFINIVLIGLNIKTGMKLSGKSKKTFPLKN